MKKSLVGTPIERASRWMFTRIISSLARTLRDEELSIAQLAALHLLDQASVGADGGVRQSALATALGRSPSTASRLIDGLVQRGLVERRETPEDRRARVLRLSPRGLALLDEIGEARARLFEKITSPLPRMLVRTILGHIEGLRSAGIDLLVPDDPSSEES
jgi:DNA-binding MarR family transcriptional regulator